MKDSLAGHGTTKLFFHGRNPNLYLDFCITMVQSGEISGAPFQENLDICKRSGKR